MVRRKIRYWDATVTKPGQQPQAVRILATNAREALVVLQGLFKTDPCDKVQVRENSMPLFDLPHK